MATDVPVSADCLYVSGEVDSHGQSERREVMAKLNFVHLREVVLRQLRLLLTARSPLAIVVALASEVDREQCSEHRVG